MTERSWVRIRLGIGLFSSSLTHAFLKLKFKPLISVVAGRFGESIRLARFAKKMGRARKWPPCDSSATVLRTVLLEAVLLA